MTSETVGPGWAIPVRLLSSVAVVGRDNEPIYLRGDLCECISTPAATPTASPNKHPDDSMTTIEASTEGAAGVNDDHETGGPQKHKDGNVNEDGEGEKDGSTSTSSQNQKRGLFGRIKGAIGMPPVTQDDGSKAAVDGDVTDVPDEATDEDDDECNDPFGFFESSPGLDLLSKQQLPVGNLARGPAPMSLTQQLVLHASLDRFEEMASSSNKGGAVRWRTPGSTGANAMWMGLLCEVEEKWTVYGYLTNTGIKFMILVENIFLNEDGSRQNESVPTFANSFPLSTNLSPIASSREGDLKIIFAKLHDLYVRHTMNPFSKIRGAIKSRVFDKGIVEVATSFNKTAMAQAISTDEDIENRGNGTPLNWM
mmetsp:Transcript_21986/g.46238  ORF Transcript_21986/g.46238 Transcript_21986/m.46238 type:complete len:367 (-) Transcript_21986:54-1154(-)